MIVVKISQVMIKVLTSEWKIICKTSIYAKSRLIQSHAIENFETNNFQINMTKIIY